MTNSTPEPTPPEDIPEGLVHQIDGLDLPALKSLKSYVEQRIDALRSPLIEEIEANAAGEILDIENHGGYAIVRKHPPDPNGDDSNTNITSVYYVRREPQIDGTESLQWSYLGDVHDSPVNRCENCGRTLEAGVDTCPNCGSTDVDHTNSGA